MSKILTLSTKNMFYTTVFKELKNYFKVNKRCYCLFTTKTREREKKKKPTGIIFKQHKARHDPLDKKQMKEILESSQLSAQKSIPDQIIGQRGKSKYITTVRPSYGNTRKLKWLEFLEQNLGKEKDAKKQLQRVKIFSPTLNIMQYMYTVKICEFR